MTVTDINELNEVIKGNEKVIVKFQTSWCFPCKQQDEILKDIQGVTIVKIDAEEQFDIADEFSIMSVPTMLFYKNGYLINKTIGVTSKERINQMFE